MFNTFARLSEKIKSEIVYLIVSKILIVTRYLSKYVNLYPICNQMISHAWFLLRSFTLCPLLATYEYLIHKWYISIHQCAFNLLMVSIWGHCLDKFEKHSMLIIFGTPYTTMWWIWAVKSYKNVYINCKWCWCAHCTFYIFIKDTFLFLISQHFLLRRFQSISPMKDLLSYECSICFCPFWLVLWAYECT